MAESLKNKALKGAVWTTLERLGTQIVGFIVSIILARLLTPGDYGTVGILGVFLSISQMFIDFGFGSALIRKSNRTDVDFSTVFWFNLVASIVFYTILFFAAPFIASYYRMPILVGVLRVIGLNLIIHACYTIQGTYLVASVNFKPQAKIAVCTCILSSALGITLAYFGFGVWALVGQSIFSSIVSCILYWLFSGWHPTLAFSFSAFRELFGFSSKIVVAGLLHTIYTNISPLIIGRKYTAEDLGYYARGDSLVQLPGGLFQSTLGRVIFPVLSSIQNDEQRLRAAYNKYLRLSTSIVAPAMLLLAACAKPLIVFLLGAKWLPCVPYIQLLAIGWMVDPMILVNLNILYVKGRSDIVLKLEIIKKAIAITIVLISVQYGIIWLCIGRVVYGYIALALNLLACGPFLGMSFWHQMREVAPIYLSAFVATTVAYLIAEMPLPSFFALTLAGTAGGALYFIFARLLKFDLIKEGHEILRRLPRAHAN